MTELKKLQYQSNQKEFQRRVYLIKNRCVKCKKCLFDNVIKESEYNPFLLEVIPQKGEIWSKNDQCKKIIEILNS